MQEKNYNPAEFLALENKARHCNKELFLLRDTKIDLIADISLIFGEIQISDTLIDLDYLEAKLMLISSEISAINVDIAEAEVLFSASVEMLETFYF
jgi:hypothetical protein